MSTLLRCTLNWQGGLAYGAGIHMLNIMKSGGNQVEHSIEEPIHHCETAFVDARKITLSLTQEGAKFPHHQIHYPSHDQGYIKPEFVRQNEDEAPLVEKSTCSFCGLHALISNCTVWKRYIWA